MGSAADAVADTTGVFDHTVIHGGDGVNPDLVIDLGPVEGPPDDGINPYASYLDIGFASAPEAAMDQDADGGLDGPPDDGFD